ncbi:TonB-dependent receptor [Aurantiacibacter zhengii]|uniref:TonB-dependent receptor n=1 Tax=Aurantiacibacter zhengii TaxID=2307003 RepID=A0A418NUN8_9SPHN|nr:TonB-dependent receptor [Aurantiacibacter zhengii]RIV87753.1 TonB-dependent receptor [Aurantiacibacter zhengii]
MKTHIRKSVLLVGCAGVAISFPVHAQTAGPQTEADVGPSNVIIVTAQNRSEDVQDVPIAMDVVGNEAIEDAGITDFQDLTRVAPVLNITQDSNYTRVAVRGVGTNSNDEGQDQSIAVNIDGEYINRPNVLNLALFDIDRIEVLRGPQGTLYGRNATGGAINFITRKAGTEFGADINATYGNFDHRKLEAGVDIPFGEVGGLRLAGLYNKRDGYFYHPNRVAANSDVVRSGTADNLGVRATLSLLPTDRLSVDLSGEYVRNENIVSAFAAYSFNAAGRGPGPDCTENGFVDAAPLIPGGQCIPVNSNALDQIEDRSSYDGPVPQISLNPNKQDSYAVRGKIEYDLGGATLTYLGGYRHTDQDTDLALPNYTFYEFGNTVDTQSHELRIGGEAGAITYQGGVFFYEEKLDNLRGLYSPFIGPNGSFINTFSRDTESRSYAGFGQVEFALNEQLTLVGGLRYTIDRREGVFGNYGFRFNAGPVAPTAPPASVLNLEQDNEQLTWLAGINYSPNVDTLIYGKVSTGYKSGGFDSVGPYDPETNTAFEAGAKLSFGSSGQHIFNVAGFYYDYKDLQTAVLLNPAIGQQIFNAGAATIWGIEAETALEVGANGRFTASINYLDAEYDELLASYAIFDTVNTDNNGLADLDPGPGIVQPDLSGNTLPQSPKWTITAGYDHVFEIGSTGMITASVYTKFKSSYFLDIFNYASSEQESFTQTDLSLKYEPMGGNWSIQAFVRNLEDEQPLAYAGFVSAGPDDTYNFTFAPPRTYGVRVGFEF